MPYKYPDKKKFDQCVRDIGVLLQNASTIFQIMEREQVKQNGFSGSQSFLMMELEDKGELSMSKVSELMNLEKSSVTRMVKILMREGILKKTDFEQDRRVSLISLTKEGKNLAKQIKVNREKYYSDIILNLPKGHVREVMNSAGVLVDALKKSL